jgi:hypothetical protein
MRAKKIVFPLILIVVLGLAACTPGAPTPEIPDTGEIATPAVTPEVTLPPDAQETAAVTAPAATQATQAGGFQTTDELITSLEAAGAVVEVTGAVDEPVFQTAAQNLTVDGQQVQVFEFADEASRQAAADTISANGFIIGTLSVDWIGQPHFWPGGRLIVLYVGEDQAVIDLIHSLMGDPITGLEGAGGGLPPESSLPPAALEAQRWLADELGITAADIPIVTAEQVDWPDACLGLAEPGEVCAQVITPGWRVALQVGDQVYELHTDQDATVVRLSPASTVVTATP